MTQNIYDNAEFFRRYAELPRSKLGLDGAPEWPALRAMLPEMRALRVVDLGCGFGWFCRWAREAGAAHVQGIDVSDKMLKRAKADTRGAGVSYLKADLDALQLPAASFDVAYSSLALHYVVNLDRLIATVHRCLVAGGKFVFSVEHPIYTAPSYAQWIPGASGNVWPLDRYLKEGARTTDWLANGVVKQHRTLAAYVNALIAAGFTIARLEEWGPTAEQIAAHPEWVNDRERPPFLLISAHR
jgi:ubiquinone/menaquinone biosynthesis C-methylase UbiE